MQDLNELLRPLVEKAINGIDKGTDFVIEQAPDLLQEFYNWHIAESLIISLFLLIGVVQVFWLKKPIERMRDYDDGVLDIIRVMVQCIVAVICLINLCVQLMMLIKILVAPSYI